MPWTVMAEPVRRRILDAVTAVLAPTGAFTTFAYAHAAWTPPGAGSPASSRGGSPS